MNNDRYFYENAREETKAFAKSSQEQPSPKMVTAVNAFFRDIDPNEGRKSVESAVAWRKIAAQRLVIDIIRDLSTAELEKAERVLKTIAGTFATVRCVGGDWKAFVARDGRTAKKVIDEQTAKDFKQGRLSIGDLIDKLYCGGIPSPRKNEEHEVRRTKGWRR